MGDVVFESLGMDQVFPCPGYLDVHDPMCPRVDIERHMTVADIESKGWKDSENLWPDNNGRYTNESDWVKAQGHPSPDDEYKKPTVTVVYCFYRQSTTTYDGDGGHRDLAPDQQYMACAECGFKDETHERMPDGSLPEAGSACPACLEKFMGEGGPPSPSYLYRVEREKLTEQRLKYPNGRLLIFAPHQMRTFYDGPWQAPTRSFPLLQMRAYESPYEQAGGSDTLLYWSLQALLDALRKQGYDQMVTSKPLLIMASTPDGKGLTDASGRQFLWSDSNDQIAYYDGPPGMISQMVHQFQGSGLPTAFPQLYGILSQSFYQARGVGQISFGPDQSKDVAFKSLMLQKESGDVPVEDHKQIWREEEGLFLGCVLDVWVHNSTAERAIRYLGDDGVMQFQLLRGSDIPNVDVVIGTPPQVKQGAVDEINALMQWSQIPLTSVRRILARRLNIAPSEVAEVEAELSAPPPGAPPMGGEQNGTPVPDFTAAQGVAGPPQMGA